MGRTRTLSSARKQEALAGYLFLSPSLIALLLFMVAPIFLIVYLSFHEWNLLGPVKFVGLANYEWLARTPVIWKSLGVTLAFVLLVIPIQTVLGLLIALAMRQRVRGTAVYRVLILLPWVCAPVVIGVIWRWILGYSNGIINQLLGVKVGWLTDPALALPAVATVAVWQGAGYVALFFYAGLESIDRDVYEAANLDGAGRIRTLFAITLPLLRPTTFFVVATGVISSFQVFDMAYALTPNGGPRGTTDVIAGRIYYEAFESFSIGHASVMALVLMLLLVTATLTQQLYFAKRGSDA